MCNRKMQRSQILQLSVFCVFFMLLDAFFWLGLFSVYADTYGFHPSHNVLQHKYPTHLKNR